MSKWGVYNMLPPIFEKITLILCFFTIIFLCNTKR